MKKYAVIFTAKFTAHANDINEAYLQMASRMRTLAIEKYGCTTFKSVTEGRQEIAISYWENLEHIQAWKEDTEHLVAQELGKTKWYQFYSVQIVQVLREYSN